MNTIEIRLELTPQNAIAVAALMQIIGGQAPSTPGSAPNPTTEAPIALYSTSDATSVSNTTTRSVNPSSAKDAELIKAGKEEPRYIGDELVPQKADFRIKEETPVKKTNRVTAKDVLPPAPADEPQPSEPQPSEPQPATPPTPAPQPAAPTISLSSIRELMAEKMTNHKTEIKAKFDSYGAKNLSLLSEDKYEEFLTFLNSL